MSQKFFEISRGKIVIKLFLYFLFDLFDFIQRCYIIIPRRRRYSIFSLPYIIFYQKFRFGK